jgi:phosphatidylserine/phosphatidylglycerophosphate/cardiolipin synthase-like enzyme
MMRTLPILLIAASWGLLAALMLAGPAMSAEPEIHFAPEEHLDRIDSELINNAETSIDLAAYVLTDRAVIGALNDAAARGVTIRVILDPRQHSDIGSLVGLDVRQKRPGPIQHLKAYEVDGQTLRTGSENFSHSAPTQDNDMIVIRDPKAAAQFEVHFAAMWQAAVPANGPRQSDLRLGSTIARWAHRWGF